MYVTNLHQWLSWIEHSATNREVGDSNSSWCTKTLIFILRVFCFPKENPCIYIQGLFVEKATNYGSFFSYEYILYKCYFIFVRNCY